MRIIEAQSARFENTKIYVHRRCRTEGSRVDGRYLRIGGIFKLGSPSLPRLQFIGLHDCLCFTVTYPEYINDLLGVTADLPEMSKKNPTNWMYSVCCKIEGSALWYFIPQTLWGFVEGDYDKVIHTTSELCTVAGLGGNHYNVLNVPIISRKFLRNRYRKISIRSDNSEK